MKLVFIHGRKQQGIEPASLKRLWLESLNKGLAKSKLSLPISDDDIIMPYYGDSLIELIEDLDKNINELRSRGTEPLSKQQDFYMSFLSEVAKDAGITNDEINNEVPAEYRERGPLNWPWVLAIIRVLDKSQRISAWTIKTVTNDVYLYLTNTAIQDTINNIVTELLPQEPFVLVGHSLGSVIGYNILRAGNNLPAIKYVSLGSPLGVQIVRQKLPLPIEMPSCLKDGWYNAFDKRDVVSLRPLDSKHFNINPAIVNNADVVNQTDNRHGIEGYLNDKMVARVIYDALT